MSNHILHLACLLAICLPIISVQLPRTPLFTRLCSTPSTEKRPSGLTAAKEPARPHPRALPSRSTSAQPPTPARFDGADSRATEGGEKVRKPWDPPFPREGGGKGKEREREWLVLPSMSEDRGDTGLDEGVGRGSTDGHGEDLRSEALSEHAVPEHTSQRQRARQRGNGIPLHWLAIGGLAGTLFVFAFAVLIAHCLAWFLVYKTEARLGEARRGILKGGDMRLCLCGT